MEDFKEGENYTWKVVDPKMTESQHENKTSGS